MLPKVEKFDQGCKITPKGRTRQSLQHARYERVFESEGGDRLSRTKNDKIDASTSLSQKVKLRQRV
tara:strand:+ start:57 stop:254 length:198 start_codon:yes stop_codon:yes gene_type:complete